VHSRRTFLPPGPRRRVAGPCRQAGDRAFPAALPADALQWSWPPYAPMQTDLESFDTEDWAPPSVVWHPQLRVGRWTVLYRRSVS